MPGADAASIEALLARWLPRLHNALPGLRLDSGELAPFVAAHPRGPECAALAGAAPGPPADAPGLPAGAASGLPTDAPEASAGISPGPPADAAPGPRADPSLEPLVELALTCALRRGDRRALDLFEERYLEGLGRSLARLRLDPGELDEVKQRVREKLLVAGVEKRLRLEEYVGSGRLGGLVQVMATREAISLARRRQRERPAGDAALGDRAAAEGWDAGVELGRAEYRAAFREAFAAAVAGLDPRERNLLRMHLLGGVTLEQLGSIYDVHRATVVRWLAAAREKVLDATRRGLKERLALRSDELDSMMASAQSRLDLSVERFFATHDRGHEPGG